MSLTKKNLKNYVVLTIVSFKKNSVLTELINFKRPLKEKFTSKKCMFC